MKTNEKSKQGKVLPFLCLVSLVLLTCKQGNLGEIKKCRKVVSYSILKPLNISEKTLCFTQTCTDVFSWNQSIWRFLYLPFLLKLWQTDDNAWHLPLFPFYLWLVHHQSSCFNHVPKSTVPLWKMAFETQRRGCIFDKGDLSLPTRGHTKFCQELKRQSSHLSHLQCSENFIIH